MFGHDQLAILCFALGFAFGIPPLLLGALRFVGVVGVDESLYSADFRAPEKLAQLLIQVAGRAGRGVLDPVKRLREPAEVVDRFR